MKNFTIKLVYCSWCHNGFVPSMGARLCGKCREESKANRAYNASRATKAAS